MIAITISLQEEEADALAQLASRIDQDTARRFTTEHFSPADIQDAVATRALCGLAALGKALAEQGWKPRDPARWHSPEPSKA